MNDLTNKRFGRWTVIEFDKDRSTSKKKYWKCQCGWCEEMDKQFSKEFSIYN